MAVETLPEHRLGAEVAPTPAAPSHAVALDLREVSKQFDQSGNRLLPRGVRLPYLPWRRRSTTDAKQPPKPVKAVDAVSFQVQRGEIFGVLGANGSGKSTLIRLVSTLLIPDSGQVTAFGLDVVQEEHRVKQFTNRVSVDAAFFKKLSAMENLAFAARLYGLDVNEALPRAHAILERIGISRKAASEPMEHMSRGMQQKVAIARAFLTSPILLLLDEPTTGLDPRSKKDVQALVLELRAQHDATVLLTTHDMDEADRLCDRIAVINQGRLIALDTPTSLKERYAGPGGTLEDVFMHLTGLTQEDAEAEQTQKENA